MSNEKTYSISCVNCGLKFNTTDIDEGLCLHCKDDQKSLEDGVINMPAPRDYEFEKKATQSVNHNSPTPFSAEEILDSKQSSSTERKYNNWYHEHECLEAIEEYASQQTAQLRQQVEVLERNILVAADREEKYVKTFSEIANACGTVNFSSHNQMKEAIQTALELSEQSLNKE